MPALAWWTAGTPSKLRVLVQVVSVAPVFLFAYLLVIGINDATFALLEGGYIDRPDWFALPDQPSWVRTALAIAAMAIGSGCLTELHAGSENELVQIRTSGFIDAVRARGGPAAPHVLPNLVAPLATLAAGRVGFLVGGLVVSCTLVFVLGDYSRKPAFRVRRTSTESADAGPTVNRPAGQAPDWTYTTRTK